MGRRREGEDTEANYREAQKQRARGGNVHFSHGGRHMRFFMLHGGRVRVVRDLMGAGWCPEDERQRSGKEETAWVFFNYCFRSAVLKEQTVTK